MNLRDKYNWNILEYDLKAYLEICIEAVENEITFNHFKNDPRYTAILEHCSKKIADNYLKLIFKNNKWLLDVKKIFNNDLLGSPKLYSFEGLLGKYSTNTIQYIGVLSNIIDNLGSLDQYKIIEIGGGYGGQCQVIQSVFFPVSYEIIDLKEVNGLQKKYLENNGCYKIVKVYNNVDSVSDKYDIVISNYALSEISEPLLGKYVEKILMNANHGYITCNSEFKYIDLLKEKFNGNVKIQKDIEGEREENFIIIW